MTHTRQALSGSQRANAAVREFRKMLPGITSFVRVITGKPTVSVQMSTFTQTDGQVIYLRPPLALADSAIHDRALCDQRDGSRLLCGACARLEEIYFAIYHEVSHIVGGSLTEQPVQQLRANATSAAETHGTPAYREYIEKQSNRVVGRFFTVYDYAGEVQEFLVGFVRGTDDYRVDTESATARPGVGIMRYHTTENILSQGVENPDGSFSSWRDQNVEAQIPVAFMVHKHGHELKDRFDPRIEQLFSEPGIKTLIETPIQNVFDVLYVSVGLMGELNKMGLYDLPLPPEPEPEPEPEPQPESDNEDSDLAGGPASGDNESAGAQGASDSGGSPGKSESGDTDVNPGAGASSDDANSDGSSSNEESSSTDDTGETSTPEPVPDGGDHQPGIPGEATEPQGGAGDDEGTGSDELEDAHGPGEDNNSPGTTSRLKFDDVMHIDSVEISELIDHASGHVKLEEVYGYEEDSSIIADEVRIAISKALVFDDTNTGLIGIDVHTGKDAGPMWIDGGSHVELSVDTHTLSPSILHARRVFSDSKMDKHVRNLKKGRLASAKLGARAWNKEDDRLFQKKIRPKGTDDEVLLALDVSGSTAGHWDRYIREIAFGMAEVMQAVGVKFSLYAHTTSSSRAGLKQNIYTIKTTQEPWGPTQKNLLSRCRGMGGSLDGHNLEFYRKVLERSMAARKTVVYFTDGAIPATNHHEEVRVLNREIATYRKLGFNVMCVALGTDQPKNYGFDTVKIESSSDIVTVIKELESRITKGR